MKKRKEIGKYTCPMHPEVISDKLGSCQKCGMKLVKKREDSNNINSAKEFIKKVLSYKLAYVIIPAFLLSFVFFLWVVWFKVIPHETPKAHYHAGFIVVEDNKLIDFSKSQYMDFEPCRLPSAKSEPDTPQQLQLEKAHLHENVGDVVHVETARTLWKDLFTNIKYPINYSDAAAYINGKSVIDFQNKQIQPYQSLVVFIGANDDTQKFLNQAVIKQHIQDVEAKSEDCGSH